eukprot:g2828.t1
MKRLRNAIPRPKEAIEEKTSGNVSKDGKLLFNCKECRSARTKCGREAPSCRRCVRLGLKCVSVPVRLGRPNKREKKQHEKLTKAVGKAKGKVCPSDLIRKVLTTALKETTSREAKESMKLPIFAMVRHWTWTALQRQTIRLLHEALTLAKLIGISLAELSDIFAAYNSQCPVHSTGCVWRDEKSYVENVSEMALNFFVGKTNSSAASASGAYSIVMTNYKGFGHFWCSEMMSKKFRSNAEANNMYGGNTCDVLASLIADSGRLFYNLFSNVLNYDIVDFKFERNGAPIKAFQKSLKIDSMKVYDREENIYSTDILCHMSQSVNGDYMIVAIEFVSDKLTKLDNLTAETQGSAPVESSETQNTPTSGTPLSFDPVLDDFQPLDDQYELTPNWTGDWDPDENLLHLFD